MAKILLVYTDDDVDYLSFLKFPLAGHTVKLLRDEQLMVWVQVAAYCQKQEVTQVVTTSPKLLALLVPDSGSRRSKPSLSNYAGSIFKRGGLEILILNPLRQCVTVPYGLFLNQRYLKKYTSPGSFLAVPKFSYTLAEPENLERLYAEFTAPDVIAMSLDIETFENPLSIRCVGFTAIRVCKTSPLGFELISTVIPCTDMFYLTYIDKFCSSPVPKILQNGKYDIAYLARYGITVIAYLWDTATMQHCWYSELPKDLAASTAFFLRDAMYWKDMAETSSLSEYYEYNARDCYGTAVVFLSWILEAPEWAKNNYVMEFPLNFPCHLCEMTGIKRDPVVLARAKEEYETKIAAQTAQLQIETATPGFNSNSPKQVAQLLRALGCGDLTSTDEKNLAKASFRHPLNDRILTQILDIRGDRKLVGTYLDESKDFNGRVLYALNPHSTDTGRLASKEHHFWCGSNIQNQPRGDSVKQTYIADTGFLFGEVDLEQAESRDTAYITGDTRLISNVSSGRDFHSLNASAFFGTPYDEIYSDELRKVILKALRDLAKRVNHGANYNMGPDVLVDTMGLKLIYKAARLLGLPRFWNPRQIATELLNRFAITYPVVRNDYPEWIKHVVATVKLLVGATGWTRYCFGNPSKSKMDLNAYIAHCPQSLNAMVLNKAFMRVFYELAIHPEHRHNFRLLAQIHDSILFLYREGHEYLADRVKECMEIPVQIKDIKGIQREFTVPAAVKIGSPEVPSKYWNLTE